MNYPNPMEFKGYTVTVATLEVNPGRWQGSWTVEKPHEPATVTNWNPEYYPTREEAEQATLAMSRGTLDII